MQKSPINKNECIIVFKKWFATLWWMPEELQGSISDNCRTASLSRACAHTYGLDMETQTYGKKNFKKRKKVRRRKKRRAGKAWLWKERKNNHGQWYLLDHIKCVGIALQAL